MRAFLAFVLVIGVCSGAIGQDQNPYARLLNDPIPFQITGQDSKLIALQKQSASAAQAELRTRYNYWLQGVGEIDGLLGAVTRFHHSRLELDPQSDVRRCLEERLAFVKLIEGQCEKSKSKAPFEAIRDIDQKSAQAYRLMTELELAKLPASPRSK